MRAPTPLLALIGLNPSGDFGDFTVYTTKRRGVLWFPRSPPKSPPTYLQRRQRNRFRFAAFCWREVPPEVRQAWSRATRLAGLRLSGLNLYVYFQLTRDRATIRTIEHQTGEQLL